MQGGDRQTDRVKAKVKQLGVALLNNLRVQCESGFGSGVISHVMLTGSEIDKINCALCLPLITSNRSLLKKLLLDCGGLLSALKLLGCHGNGRDDDDADEGHSADCRRLMSDLFNTAHSDLTCQLPSLYFSLLAECLSALTAPVKPELGKKCPTPPRVPSQVEKVLPPPSKKARLADTCPYGAASFDLLLLLDDGSRIPACGEAVAGAEGSEGAGSDYFRVLLRGGFVEAQGDKSIPIKDVSVGMLLPVLHYLHGCRLTGEAESEGYCQVLNTLVLDGLNFCQTQPEAEDLSFQKTPLGETMMGACRFIVDELQRDLEELCVSLLVSTSTKASEGRAGKTCCKMEQDCPESAEESLAIRTSELELTGTEKKVEDGQTKRMSLTLEGPESKGVSPLVTGPKVKSAAAVPEPDCPREPALIPKSESKGSDQPVKVTAPGSDSSPQRGVAVLSSLLPQVYCFSQHYNFPSLRRACLTVLLGSQDSPRPFSSSTAGDCLRRLAGADCTDTLIQDVLSLASGALS